MPSTLPCPRCHNTDYTRSHRTAWERLVPGLRAYRCIYCQQRSVHLWQKVALQRHIPSSHLGSPPGVHPAERASGTLHRQ